MCHHLNGQTIPQNLKGLLPNKIAGWDVENGDNLYNSNNLYEYINGGAELFLSYGFKQMIARIYSSPGQPDILVDLFDMGESKNAYGVFSYSRENEDSSFGQGSQYSPGLLLFWKDRFYVSILFSPPTEEAKKAAFLIAREIESSIKTQGALPDVLNFLPKEKLIKKSIRYFRHYIWLNSYYFISNENILNINDSADAVFAKYGDRNENSLLLLIKYQSTDDAEKALSVFIDSYAPELKNKAIIQHDEHWIGYRLNRNLLSMVFKAATKESVEQLLTEAEIKILPVIPVNFKPESKK
jgi:hypothetical protein